MSWYNKVVWSEGLFLRPQLFQQQERYLEHYAHKRAAAPGPFFWGFHHHTIDNDALSLGKLVLSAANGLFQDGTPFDVPGHTTPPAPLAIGPAHLNEVICLAVPMRAPNAEETNFEDADASLARYRVFEAELPDANSIAQGPALVQLSNLRIRLIPESEMTSSWIGLPLARVMEIRADGSVRLDPTHIPPVNALCASHQLCNWLIEIHGLLHLRADAVAQALLRSGGRDADTAEIADYLVLLLLNRHEPVLKHLIDAGTASPETLYTTFATLAGELSTFLRTDTRRPATYAAYRHGEPHACIRPLVDDLRYLLNVVLERGAQSIELREERHGLHMAVIDPVEIPRFARFVLAISAQMPPDTLVQQFSAQTKLGSSAGITDLIRSHLPGLPLRALPVPPRQIPFHAGHVYFEVSQAPPLWDQVLKSGGLVLHVAGSFPGLRMELWGVRE